jgi:hypothetical protein
VASAPLKRLKQRKQVKRRCDERPLWQGWSFERCEKLSFIRSLKRLAAVWLIASVLTSLSSTRIINNPLSGGGLPARDLRAAGPLTSGQGVTSC